jgi:DNA-binding NarL/FixJ family response regulator
MTGRIRLAVVDDHPAIASGVWAELRDLVDLAPEYVQATSASQVPEGRPAPEGHGPVEERPGDVALLDVRLEDGSDPAHNVRWLTGRGWNVLLFTQERRPAVLGRCLQAGALGMIGKHETWDVLAEAITHVATGEAYLSSDWAAVIEALTEARVPDLAPREAEVLRLYAAGLPVRSVARHVGIAEETVKEYLVRVRRKYLEAGRPASSRTELYIRAVEDDLLPNPATPPPP